MKNFVLVLLFVLLTFSLSAFPLRTVQGNISELSITAAQPILDNSLYPTCPQIQEAKAEVERETLITKISLYSILGIIVFGTVYFIVK